MIVDLPEPRDVEIRSQSPAVTVRSRNPIRQAAADLIATMRGDGRDRDRPDDFLDDTRSRSANPSPSNDSDFRVNERRVQIPQWLLLFLVLQGGTGIWWAATMQSDLRYVQLENVKLWTKIQELAKADEDQLRDLRDEIKDEVSNQLVNRGIIRINQNP